MSNTNTNSFKRFLKQNLALVIIVACAIAVCALVLILNADKPNVPVDAGNVKPPDAVVDQPNPPPTSVVPTYTVPVVEYTLGLDYSRDTDYVLVYKKTLNEYSVHNGIDFLAAEGTDVVAVFDGTVTAVSNTFGMGHCVEITHTDGCVSRYMSLADDVCVTMGQNVQAGQKIGTIGTTAADESLEGAHLHFELIKDGEYINPRTVISNID